MSIAAGYIGTNTLWELELERNPSLRIQEDEKAAFTLSLMRADNDRHRQLLHARREIDYKEAIIDAVRKTNEQQEKILALKGFRYPYA